MPSLRKIQILATPVLAALQVAEAMPRASDELAIAMAQDTMTRCRPGMPIGPAHASELFMAAVALRLLFSGRAEFELPGWPGLNAWQNLSFAIHAAIAQDKLDDTIDRYQPWESEVGGTRVITGVPDRLVAFRVPGEDHERLCPVSSFHEWIAVFKAAMGDPVPIALATLQAPVA